MNPAPSPCNCLESVTIQQVYEASLPYFLRAFTTRARELDFVCAPVHHRFFSPSTRAPTKLLALKTLRYGNIPQVPGIIIAPFLAHLTLPMFPASDSANEFAPIGHGAALALRSLRTTDICDEVDGRIIQSALQEVPQLLKLDLTIRHERAIPVVTRELRADGLTLPPCCPNLRNLSVKVYLFSRYYRNKLSGGMFR